MVSGRPAAFLAEHLVHPGSAAAVHPPGPGLQLVGLYGLEWTQDDGVITRAPDAERWRLAIDDAADRLRSLSPAGVVVERKGLAVTLHWRTVPDQEAWAVEAGSAEAEHTGLHLHPGRMSLELRPPLPIDKGTVVEQLTEGCAAACFLGDALGALPAFAALEPSSVGPW